MDIRDDETALFDEVMEMVGRHPCFDRYVLKREAALRFPGLDI